MAELKKHTSFEALKSNKRSGNVYKPEENVFLEFEAFLKRLQSEYSNKIKSKTDNGKQSNR